MGARCARLHAPVGMQPVLGRIKEVSCCGGLKCCSRGFVLWNIRLYLWGTLSLWCHLRVAKMQMLQSERSLWCENSTTCKGIVISQIFISVWLLPQHLSLLCLSSISTYLQIYFTTLPKTTVVNFFKFPSGKENWLFLNISMFYKEKHKFLTEKNKWLQESYKSIATEHILIISRKNIQQTPSLITDYYRLVEWLFYLIFLSFRLKKCPLQFFFQEAKVIKFLFTWLFT